MSTMGNGREYAFLYPEYRHILMIFGISEPFYRYTRNRRKKALKTFFFSFAIVFLHFYLLIHHTKWKMLKRMRRRSGERAKKEAKKIFSSLLSSQKGVSVSILMRQKEAVKQEGKKFEFKRFLSYVFVCLCL